MLELTQLQAKFEENVLDATNAWTHHVTDPDELRGLNEAIVAAAERRAKERGVAGWVLSLDQPTYVAVVTDAESEPLRRAFFGDFHVHTALSMDAYTWDLRATPDDAYRFARGEALLLPPLDAEGRSTRSIALERPLDFAAVTDHSEWLGEVSLCTRPGRPVHDSPACKVYRGELEPEV